MAMKNCHSGLSLNDHMRLPPNALRSLSNMLAHCRTFKHSTGVDVSRTLQSVCTRQKEKFLSLVLRKKEEQGPWQARLFPLVWQQVASASGMGGARQLGVKTSAEYDYALLCSSNVLSGTAAIPSSPELKVSEDVAFKKSLFICSKVVLRHHDRGADGPAGG